jgi:hypothetical protein
MNRKAAYRAGVALLMALGYATLLLPRNSADALNEEGGWVESRGALALRAALEFFSR